MDRFSQNDVLKSEYRLHQPGRLQRSSDPKGRDDPGPKLPSSIGSKSGEQSRTYQYPYLDRSISPLYRRFGLILATGAG